MGGVRGALSRQVEILKQRIMTTKGKYKNSTVFTFALNGVNVQFIALEDVKQLEKSALVDSEIEHQKELKRVHQEGREEGLEEVREHSYDCFECGIPTSVNFTNGKDPLCSKCYSLSPNKKS